MIYNVSGFPCSDELYHTGIPDMKWYRRRFQDKNGRLTDEGFLRYYGHPRYRNPDGSLTPEGKARYGKVADAAKNAADAVGKAAKATGQAVSKAGKAVAKYEINKFKRNHPWTMSDTELDASLARAKKIDTLSQTRQAIRGRRFAGKFTNTLYNAFDRSINNLASEVSSNLGRKYVNDLIEREKEERENKMHSLSNRLRREFYNNFADDWDKGIAPTMKQLEDANKYFDALRNIEEPKKKKGDGGGK